MPQSQDTGRPAIFRGKDRTKPVKAYMTAHGKNKVNDARKRLAKIVGWKAADVKDGDVVEFLARGEEDTIKYLKSTGQIS